MVWMMKEMGIVFGWRLAAEKELFGKQTAFRQCLPEGHVKIVCDGSETLLLGDLEPRSSVHLSAVVQDLGLCFLCESVRTGVTRSE